MKTALSKKIDRPPPLIHISLLMEERSLLPYLGWSNVLFIALFFFLYISQQWLFPHFPDKVKQLIDIEFSSVTDFQNKQDILPATIPKPSLGKRISPVKQSTPVIPALSAKSANNEKFEQPVIAGKSISQKTEIRYAISYQQPKPTVAFMPVLQSSMTTVYPNKTYSNKIPGKRNLPAATAIDLEEVGPPELIEIKENDGDDSPHIWQDGGSSKDGLGANVVLADYLKELHKKLKNCWSPPANSAHNIKVLFRLTTEGKLVSLKLLTSSGDSTADKSALAAITEAAPFGKLPKNYPAQFLDLVYTFNYSADRLEEVSPSKQ